MTGRSISLEDLDRGELLRLVRERLLVPSQRDLWSARWAELSERRNAATEAESGAFDTWIAARKAEVEAIGRREHRKLRMAALLAEDTYQAAKRRREKLDRAADAAWAQLQQTWDTPRAAA